VIFLRQSTSKTVRIGPFVSSQDGVTAVTDLSIATADVRLSKAGAAFAQKGDTSTTSHDENGYYAIALNATDTGTAGSLRIAVSKSGALPVWEDAVVLPQAMYDATFGTVTVGDVVAKLDTMIEEVT
jgi:hypothetical protein